MTATVRRLCPDRISCDCSSSANLHYCVTLSSGSGGVWGGGFIFASCCPYQAAKLPQGSVLEPRTGRLLQRGLETVPAVLKILFQ